MATKVLVNSEKGKEAIASEGQVAPLRSCEWKTPGGAQMHCYNPLEVSFLWEKIFAENEYGDRGIVYSPGAVIVDVGGNVGVFCHYADARCAGDCTIIAIEPIPQLFHCLQKNVKSLRANCSLHNVAAGATTECDPITLDFLPRYSLLSGSQAHSNCAGYEQLADLYNLPLDLVQDAFECVEVQCPQSTLSDILQQEGVSRIDLLKVDCEGVEYDVMLGISEADWQKIQQVVVETHQVGTRFEDMRHLLESKGFKVTGTEPMAPCFLLHRSGISGSSNVPAINTCTFYATRQDQEE